MMMARIVPETYVPVEEQLLIFAGACLLGIPCGLGFDALRLLRRLLPHHWLAVAVEDVLFAVYCAFLMLGYVSGFARGEFRMYDAVGCFLGFILYECTLGSLVVGIGGWICRILRSPFSIMKKWIVAFCRKVCTRFVKNTKKQQKEQKNVQNDLQDTPEMVYNKNST